jgi:CheY-like chemotaxis protein
LKALIGEDDAVAALVLKSLLRRLDISVDEAGDGDAVVCMCRNNLYDIVFLDMNLPKQDGFTVLRTIRDIAQKCGVHLPVVAVTAETGASYREQCLEAGLNDFLTKPVSFEQIRDVVTRRCGYSVDYEEHRETQTSDEIFDPKPLLQRLSNDYAAFKETLEIFLDSFEDRLQELKTNAASKNREAVCSSAHAIKGMCRTVGAFRLGEIGLNLERSKDSGADYETIYAEIGALEHAYYNETKPRIQKLCSDPKALQ